MKTTFFFFAALAFASILHADDVYLKTGFVFRNVQVRDSTDGLLYIIRDGKTISILLSSVHKIEAITYDPNSKSKYELFSSDMAEQYKIEMEQEEKQKAAERARQIKIQQLYNIKPSEVAPSVPPSLSNVPARVERGRILTSDSKMIAAERLTISKDSVEFFLESSPLRYSLALNKVDTILGYKGNRAGIGGLIGMGVGATVGLVVSLGTIKTETREIETQDLGRVIKKTIEIRSTSQIWPLYVILLVGTGVGVLIGSIFENWQTVYTASTASASKFHVQENPCAGGLCLSFRLDL